MIKTNWKKLDEGIIQGDSLAMYKEGMHSDAFVEESFGSEMLHGAIQFYANKFVVSVLETWDNGNPKVLQYFNDGEIPSNDIMTGRMINFSDKPNKGNPGDISKRGLGFRQETMRAGLFLHREKPGENGCIVRQEFSYYYDRGGEELIDESDYTFDNIYENCGSIHWKLIQTDIPNIEKFEYEEITK